MSDDHTKKDRYTDRRGALAYIEETYDTSLHISFIDRRLADGSLPSYRLGPRMVRIKLSDLDALFVPVNA